MSTSSMTKPPLRHRIAEELKALLALTLYLYICLGALLLLKTSILHDQGISYAAWGAAAIKAVLLAKFMMVGWAMHIGQRYMHKPLIWPTLHKALLFLILLLILTTVEEIGVGFIHARPLNESLRHIVGPTFYEGLAVSLVMFLILVPYCAFTTLAEVMGEDKLVRLFFFQRTPDRS
jgi:hypothetical protein